MPIAPFPSHSSILRPPHCDRLQRSKPDSAQTSVLGFVVLPQFLPGLPVFVFRRLSSSLFHRRPPLPDSTPFSPLLALYPILKAFSLDIPQVLTPSTVIESRVARRAPVFPSACFSRVDNRKSNRFLSSRASALVSCLVSRLLD